MVGDTLNEFLQSALSKPFALGHHDCGLWLADWYMAKTGKPDPAAHLRGASYSSEQLEHHSTAIIQALALEAASEPKRGDIGLLRLAGRLVGGICTGERWIVLSDTGGLGAIPMRSGRLFGAWKVR